MEGKIIVMEEKEKILEKRKRREKERKEKERKEKKRKEEKK